MSDEFLMVSHMPKPPKAGSRVFATKASFAAAGPRERRVEADTEGTVVETSGARYLVKWDDPPDALGWYSGDSLYVPVPKKKGHVHGYYGDPLPKWVQPGVKLRVKATPHLRRYGVSVSGALSPHDCAAHPGEVGEVIKEGSPDHWDYYVAFSRGRAARLTKDRIEDFAREK